MNGTNVKQQHAPKAVRLRAKYRAEKLNEAK